jgi:hypothetical protein
MSESSAPSKDDTQAELKQLIDRIVPIMPIAGSVFSALQSSLQTDSSSFRQAFIQLVSASSEFNLIDMAVKMHDFFNLIEKIGIIWKQESGSSEGLKNLMKEKKRKSKKSANPKEERNSPSRRSVAEVLDSLGISAEQKDAAKKQTIAEEKSKEIENHLNIIIETEKNEENNEESAFTFSDRKSMRVSRSERKSRSADLERTSISRVSSFRHPKSRISLMSADLRTLKKISAVRKGSVSNLEIPLSESSIFHISCTFSPTVRDHISQNPDTYALYDRFTRLELYNVPPFEYVEPIAPTEQDLSMLREFCRRGQGFSPASGVVCFPIFKNSGKSGIVIVVYFLYEAFIEQLELISSPEAQHSGKIVLDLDSLQFGSMEQYPFLGSEYKHDCLHWYWRPGVQAFFQKLSRKSDVYLIARSSWDHLYHCNFFCISIKIFA